MKKTELNEVKQVVTDAVNNKKILTQKEYYFSNTFPNNQGMF